MPDFCHYQTNLWLGTSASTSAIHFDSNHNLLCVIRGAKTVTLFPPDAHAGLDSCVLQAAPAYTGAYHHASMTDVDCGGSGRGGNGRDSNGTATHTAARESRVVIGSGESLFIPEGWWHTVQSEPATVAVNIWWEGTRATAVDIESTSNIPLCYLGRLCMARQVERMQELLLQAAAPNDYALLRAAFHGSCGGGVITTRAAISADRSSRGGDSRSSKTVAVTSEVVDHDSAASQQRSWPNLAVSLSRWSQQVPRPLAAASQTHAQEKSDVSCDDTEGTMVGASAAAKEALIWLQTPLANAHADGERSGGAGLCRRECLAFLRRAPMSLQLLVLPSLASLDPARWRTIFHWASHDPMTAYALTTAWEAENQRPDQSQSRESEDGSENASSMNKAMRTGDGSNLVMVDFYRKIGACLVTPAAAADYSWEGALLCMRDEYGKQAMAEVLKTVYGYGVETSSHTITAQDAAMTSR